MLKNIFLISILNILFYISQLSSREGLHAISYEQYDNKHLIFISVVIWGIGFLNFRKTYIFLLQLFLVTIGIGLIEYNFFIDYMNACPQCGLTDFCTHDCDGSCSGWFTFELGKDFILGLYLFFGVSMSLAFLMVKKFFDRRENNVNSTNFKR